MYARPLKPAKVVTYSSKKMVKPVEYLGVVVPLGWLPRYANALKTFMSTLKSDPSEFLKNISLSGERDTLIQKLKKTATQNQNLYPAGYELHIIECDESVSLLFTGKGDATEVLLGYLQKLIKSGYEEFHDAHKVKFNTRPMNNSDDYEFLVNPPLSPIDHYLSCAAETTYLVNKDEGEADNNDNLRSGCRPS